MLKCDGMLEHPKPTKTIVVDDADDQRDADKGTPPPGLQTDRAHVTPAEQRIEDKAADADTALRPERHGLHDAGESQPRNSGSRSPTIGHLVSSGEDYIEIIPHHKPRGRASLNGTTIQQTSERRNHAEDLDRRNSTPTRPQPARSKDDTQPERGPPHRVNKEVNLWQKSTTKSAGNRARASHTDWVDSRDHGEHRTQDMSHNRPERYLSQYDRSPWDRDAYSRRYPLPHRTHHERKRGNSGAWDSPTHHETNPRRRHPEPGHKGGGYNNQPRGHATARHSTAGGRGSRDNYHGQYPPASHARPTRTSAGTKPSHGTPSPKPSNRAATSRLKSTGPWASTSETTSQHDESAGSYYDVTEQSQHEEQTDTDRQDETPRPEARTGPQDAAEEEGAAKEKEQTPTSEGELEEIAHEGVNLLWLKGGSVWGNTTSDANPRLYPTTLICQNHPQEAELKAAALLHTHPEQRTRAYRTPIGKAGAEKGKTLVSAKVIDTRSRRPNFEDTIQVMMEPGEKAGPVIERAQRMLDRASGVTWKPWREHQSGISCRRSTGEELLSTETMPTEEHTIYLKGGKRARKRANERLQTLLGEKMETSPQATEQGTSMKPKGTPSDKKRKHKGDRERDTTSPEHEINTSAAEEIKRLKSENARLRAIEERLRDEREIARGAVKGALRAKHATKSKTPDHSEESRSESEGPPLGKRGKRD